MKNLQQIAQELHEDINENTEWLENEINFVLDGSHKSGHTTYNHIMEVLDHLRLR